MSPENTVPDAPRPDSARIAVSSASASKVRCPYCHDDLTDQAKLAACDLCGTDHHADCLTHGCAVFGCPGAPNAKAPLTPLRVAVWVIMLSTFVPLSAGIGGLLLRDTQPLAGKILGGAVVAVLLSWFLRRVDRANAAARLRLNAPAVPTTGKPSTTEEALDIIGLSAFGGQNAMNDVLQKLAADAPSKPLVPAGAELPSACPECEAEIEEPDGKEEPDWFCYHCGGSLIPAGDQA